MVLLHALLQPLGDACAVDPERAKEAGEQVGRVQRLRLGARGSHATETGPPPLCCSSSLLVLLACGQATKDLEISAIAGKAEVDKAQRTDLLSDTNQQITDHVRVGAPTGSASRGCGLLGEQGADLVGVGALQLLEDRQSLPPVRPRLLLAAERP